ncbi:MAG: HNH endonuclease [Planctomycetota bacterium]
MAFEKWLSELRDVNPSGEAPHKPLLLLTVLKAAERDGELPEVLLLSPELVYQFRLFEHIVAHRRKQKLDIRMPFHHLKSSRVWIPLDKHGEPSTHRSVTTCVRLDPDFRAACLDAEFRQQAKTILIETYFRPEEQIALREMMGLPADVVIPELESDEKPETPEQAARSEGRSARFRLDVVPAYNYTCALTGYRIVTVDRGTIVDAAHIAPFRSSKNNDVRNGLSLCKNAHWLFDVGLWSLDDDYRVIVADSAFDEAAPEQTALKNLAGRRIQLPRNTRFWPLVANLKAHRRLHGF